MPRFLLDENLPLQAARLLDAFGFPVVGIGDGWELPRGSSDVTIARWCGENDVVWITIDQDPRKDPVVAAAVVDAGTSVIIVPGSGMTMRRHLVFLARGFEDWDWERQVEAGRRPFRARARRRGRLIEFTVAPGRRR